MYSTGVESICQHSSTEYPLWEAIVVILNGSTAWTKTKEITRQVIFTIASWRIFMVSNKYSDV